MAFLQRFAEEVLQTSRRTTVEDIDVGRIDEGLLQDFVATVKKAVKATKVFFKRIRGKVITFFQKGNETGVVLPKTKQVVMKWSGKSVYVNPKLLKTEKSTKKESKDLFGKILGELRTPAETLKAATKNIQQVGAKTASIEEPENALDDIQSAEVDYEDLKTIFSQLAFSVKFRTKYNQKIPAMLLMGPPGVGKTTVTDFFGEEKGMVVKKLEIGAIYKEIVGGFPIVHEIISGKQEGELSPEEQKKLGTEQKHLAVKIVQSDLLPPSKDARPWVLFMDEFNRDSEKMGAVMNLCLTGNIGAQYYLPLKTLVIASGNIGGDTDDGDDVPVAEMDSATWDRFDRKALLAYDWVSRSAYGAGEEEFGGEEEKETPYEKQAGTKITPEVKKKREWFKSPEGTINMGGDPAVIQNFIDRTTKEKGTSKWKIPLSQFNPDAKATLTPRTLSILARNMKLAALRDWTEDSLVGSHDKEWYEKKYKDEGFSTPQAYYLHVNQLNKKYFADIARTTLGAGPADVITDMFTHLQKTKEESQNVSVEDVLTNWTGIRGSKPKPPAKLANEFTLMLPDLLVKFKNKAEFAKFLDKKSVKIPEKLDDDAAVWAAINIHNFIKDSGLGMDVAAGIAKNLAELRNPKEAGKEEEGGKKKKAPVENEFLDEVLAFLIKKSDVFGKAWMEVTEAAQEEAKKKSPSALKQALSLANKGVLATGPVPKYVSSNLSGENLKNYLILTNLQMLLPSMDVKTLKTKKTEKADVEEAMRRLFDKML